MGKRPPSPPAQDLELQDNTEFMPSSPLAQDPELQDIMWKRPPSPPAQDPELQNNMGERAPSPPAQDSHSHPSTEQLELLPNTDRKTPPPLPSTNQTGLDVCNNILQHREQILGVLHCWSWLPRRQCSSVVRMTRWWLEWCSGT
jgi:hypothetical protein